MVYDAINPLCNGLWELSKKRVNNLFKRELRQSYHNYIIHNLFIKNSSKKYMPLEITKVKNSFFNLPAKRPHDTSLNSDKILTTFDIMPSNWKEELNKEIINR